MAASSSQVRAGLIAISMAKRAVAVKQIKPSSRITKKISNSRGLRSL
jgi:hypothetical protein